MSGDVAPKTISCLETIIELGLVLLVFGIAGCASDNKTLITPRFALRYENYTQLALSDMRSMVGDSGEDRDKLKALIYERIVISQAAALACLSIHSINDGDLAGAAHYIERALEYEPLHMEYIAIWVALLRRHDRNDDADAVVRLLGEGESSDYVHALLLVMNQEEPPSALRKRLHKSEEGFLDFIKAVQDKGREGSDS